MTRVAVFGPHPLLTVTIEARADGGDDIHLHAGGQGVWVGRMAAELGGAPILCCLLGGESGAVLAGLVHRLGIEVRAVATAGANMTYVTDRRDGDRRLVATAAVEPPSRHEVDDLVASTTAAALDAGVLVVCNPFPGDALPLDTYSELVTDVRDQGTKVLVDLSSPRLESALEGGPDLVKLNDWELAQYVVGPVDTLELMRAACERILEAGARSVVVTRGEEPALWLDGERAWWLAAPRFRRGMREGCGDTMMGATAAALASGSELADALRIGAAAGAANFLRHGLGTGRREVAEGLLERVELYPAA